ncbi:MAG TPA: MBL fold metallo-hydrolase [Vicinamibacterales bacterium]|nr:MBL fold metallo-hydrolase [Vicinamibacterales bacterium]
MTLTFLGAARTVTGSKFLLETDGAHVLFDAGLFQGLKALRERNWQPLAFDAASLDSVVLTHAHLDHVGFLPRLVNQGYRGRVFCTPGTADLARIILADAGRIQEEDAERANRKGYTKHQPALPLFSEADAARAMTMLQPVGYDRPMPVAPGLTVEFVNAGHLLGSSFVRARLEREGRTILFGGDLGRFGRPVLPDPEPPGEADVLLCESTYGDRTHERDDHGGHLARIVNETIERGGRVVIPAFAVGRVEELLYWIDRLEDEKRIPEVPVYVDSPMAVAALVEYRKRIGELDPELSKPNGDEPRRQKLQAERRVCGFCTAKLKVVTSIAESRAVQESKGPAIIISSSGMATGGRVLHHLKTLLPDPRHTVLLSGYQAAGTRGRAMEDGAKVTRIHGQEVNIRARIERLDSLSAHADADEIMRWLRMFPKPPALTCLVHGEPGPMDTLMARIERELKWTVRAPEPMETIELP